MKKGLWILLGIAAIGGTVYALTSGEEISVERIDYLTKTVVVQVNGKQYSYKYGTPGIGYSLSTTKTLEISGTKNNLVVGTWKGESREVDIPKQVSEVKKVK